MIAANGLPGGHVPVMLREVLSVLAPRDDGIYVDGTFGLGGYSEALLRAARCTVWGIDRDPVALERGERLVQHYEDRLTLLSGRYGEMGDLLAKHDITAVDGVALDLGVSSIQIDDPARGFSFRADGPLDMRMERDGASAADIVNTLDEASLARIIHHYGEERFARQIARAIVAARTEAPIDTTGRLATIIRRVVRQGRDGIDPSTRTFQALRIHVNDELGELDRGLAAAERILAPGGRLAVVAFHSLEDRKIKRFLKARSAVGASKSRLLPGEVAPRAASFELIAKKAMRPKDDEIASNPRARSARLRAAVRTGAAAWPVEASPAEEVP